jgi:hypothetical protein
MAGAIAVMFVALGIATIVRLFNPNLADILAPIVMFLVGFPLMLLGFYHADRTYLRYPQLICPYCQGNLSRAKSVIIATGNCSSCGRRVLADDAIGN